MLPAIADGVSIIHELGALIKIEKLYFVKFKRKSKNSFQQSFHWIQTVNMQLA